MSRNVNCRISQKEIQCWSLLKKDNRIAIVVYLLVLYLWNSFSCPKLNSTCPNYLITWLHCCPFCRNQKYFYINWHISFRFNMLNCLMPKLVRILTLTAAAASHPHYRQKSYSISSDKSKFYILSWPQYFSMWFYMIQFSSFTSCVIGKSCLLWTPVKFLTS